MRVAVPWNHVIYSCKKSRCQITWNHYESRDLSLSGLQLHLSPATPNLHYGQSFEASVFQKLDLNDRLVKSYVSFWRTSTLTPWHHGRHDSHEDWNWKKRQNILGYSLQSVTYTNCKINLSRLIFVVWEWLWRHYTILNRCFLCAWQLWGILIHFCHKSW